MLHWPEYFIEAALLGAFMVAACVGATVLEHPASPIRRRLPAAFARRALMGLLMGVTAVGLIYSPWGQRSGAHMNPATTLTFLWLGKVPPLDATFYVAAHLAGAAAGVATSALFLRSALRHPNVNYVITAPGPRGSVVAWIAEFAIAAGMMGTVLVASNDERWSPYTGLLAGALVVSYITLEAPLSGMSLNPARSFGSAAAARHWRGLGIYLTAPLLGMLAAAAVYVHIAGRSHVFCAKLCHNPRGECVFSACRHAELGHRAHH
ncbi:MAG: aquaporin [Phycisphaerae bacterium]